MLFGFGESLFFCGLLLFQSGLFLFFLKFLFLFVVFLLGFGKLFDGFYNLIDCKNQSKRGGDKFQNRLEAFGLITVDGDEESGGHDDEI